MEQMEEQDIVRLKEILSRSAEFIAYFELAETKMIEWRQNIEQRASTYQHQFQQQLNSLQTELNSFREIFTESGMVQFRLAAENTLNQGKKYLQSMQKTEQNILQQMANNQRELTKLSEKTLHQITQYTEQAIDRIDDQLAQYDVQHFHRIANESCEHVEKSAQGAIVKSGKLLRLFQWRTISLAILTTLLTAFVFSLYVSDEYPWEIHQHALNERGAGKMLMKAWPQLSQEERAKILGEEVYTKS